MTSGATSTGTGTGTGTAGGLPTGSRGRLFALGIILELPSAVPGSLDLLIPLLASDLEADRVDRRFEAIVTLGRLFSSSGGAHLAKRHENALGRWVGRLADKTVPIRREMCSQVAAVLAAHAAALTPALAGPLGKRLVDADEGVRRAAVAAVADTACSASISVVPTSLLLALAARADDTSADVVREAVTGLAQAYGAHVAPLWEAEEGKAREEDDEEGVKLLLRVSLLGAKLVLQ